NTRLKTQFWTLLGLAGMFVMVGCGSLPRSGMSDPRGELLPAFTVYSENTPQVTLPGGFESGGVLVIIYKESGRDDAHEWMDAISANPLTKPAVVVETNPKWGDIDWSSKVLPGAASIDEVYPLIELTGAERPDLARVVYFNESGRIVWLWDGGYHDLKLSELRAAMRP
ncbi:MAG: hypothetical protein AAGB06_06735, partial [Verrucomicrobiota bacterium]